MAISIEVSRRDIGRAWKKFYPWPESYTRYIQYVWSRCQANICLFSPIHFDTAGDTIPAEDWNIAANKVIEDYSLPPFGTFVSYALVDTAAGGLGCDASGPGGPAAAGMRQG